MCFHLYFKFQTCNSILTLWYCCFGLSKVSEYFFHYCRFVFKVHNEFILPSEKEGFIHRMGDIIKRAESLMAKEQPVHSSGHRLPQPAFHSGVNSLSSSQVSSTCPLPVIHITALLAENKGSSSHWAFYCAVRSSWITSAIMCLAVLIWGRPINLVEMESRREVLPTLEINNLSEVLFSLSSIPPETCP